MIFMLQMQYKAPNCMYVFQIYSRGDTWEPLLVLRPRFGLPLLQNPGCAPGLWQCPCLRRYIIRPNIINIIIIIIIIINHMQHGFLHQQSLSSNYYNLFIVYLAHSKTFALLGLYAYLLISA